jgi:hypothetical protein
MQPLDLFDALGGRDNLRLMCEAEEFYEYKVRGLVRFTVSDKYVWLSSCVGGYAIYVYDIEAGTMSQEGLARDAEGLRELFERYTGYSLGFGLRE